MQDKYNEHKKGKARQERTQKTTLSRQDPIQSTKSIKGIESSFTYTQEYIFQVLIQYLIDFKCSSIS